MAGPQRKQDTPKTLAVKMFAGASSAWISEFATLPLDTAKVRLQIQGEQMRRNPGQPLYYRGVFGTMNTIRVDEGLRKLWTGFVPGIMRHTLFAGLRLGLYEPTRDAISKYTGTETGLLTRATAALATGAFAISVAQPTDLVKIRLQGEGRLPAGVPRKYTGVVDAFVKIARKDGIVGLWKGLGPNIGRNATMNVVEVASYDSCKVWFGRVSGLGDTTPTHVGAALLAGALSTIVGSPIDVVKTRVMNSQPGVYSGAVDCALQLLRNEGVTALYKGVLPNYLRVGIFNLIMFVTFERIKKQLAAVVDG